MGLVSKIFYFHVPSWWAMNSPGLASAGVAMNTIYSSGVGPRPAGLGGPSGTRGALRTDGA